MVPTSVDYTIYPYGRQDYARHARARMRGWLRMRKGRKIVWVDAHEVRECIG